jgi:hypothetical protein
MPAVLKSTSLFVNTNQALVKNFYNEGGVVTVNFCNTGATSATVRMAVSSNQSAPNASEWLIWDRAIAPSGVVDLSGLAIGPGQYVVVRSSSASVVAQAWGYIYSDTAVSSDDIVTASSPPLGVFEVVSNTQFTLPSGVTQSSAVAKYGGTSISFAGSLTSYLTLTNNAWLSTTNPRTIEYWAYPTTAIASTQGSVLFSNTSTTQTMTNSRGFGPYYTNTTGSAAGGIGSQGLQPATGVSNAWNHVAFVITATTVTHYLNGVSQGTDTFVTAPFDFRQGTYNQLVLGAWPTFSFWRYTGYLDDVRFSSGARYTANFTPPAARLTVDGTTVALIQSL